MSDFDELSRRKWEHRRTRRQDLEGPDLDERTTTGRLSLDDDPDQADRRSPLNPRWRRERTTRNTGRRATGAIYKSPQEFQLWLQKGGWMWGAVGAVVVVAGLVFLLMQSQDAQSNNTTVVPPADTTGDPVDREEGAGVNTNIADEAADDAESAPLQQPTLTPASSSQSQQPDLGAFVVSNTGTQGLFLRAEPNTSGTIVETLPEGTQVEQISEDTIGANYVWRHVRTPSGQEGWVAVDWLQPAP